MTIIDFMKTKLSKYPKISDFLLNDDIHIDFTEPTPTNYGLSSTGDSLIKEDILGNQTRQHNFAMYAISKSYTDYNRLENSNFLYELSHWLENLEVEEFITEINEKAINSKFIKARCANAMSMGLVGETISDGIIYQIQIYAEYILESEN
jgi:hypothetical protein|nr:MAG TPA: Minor capsid protein from bacteriophage [Caudoviricetes sp.]